MMQAVIGKWRHWAEEEKADREAYTYSERSAMQTAAYDKRMAELNEEAESLRQQCQRTREETVQHVAPLRAAHEEAMLRAERLEALISQMGEVASRVQQLSETAKPGGFVPQCSPAMLAGTNNAAATELLKNTLHQILRDIDPQYRPPSPPPVVVEVVRPTTPVLMRANAAQPPAVTTFVPTGSPVTTVMGERGPPLAMNVPGRPTPIVVPARPGPGPPSSGAMGASPLVRARP